MQQNGLYLYYWNIDNEKVKPRPNRLFFSCDKKSNSANFMSQSPKYPIFCTYMKPFQISYVTFCRELIKYISANVFDLVESLTFFRATPFRMADMRSLLRSVAGGVDLGGDTLRSWIRPRCSEANTSSIVPVVKQNAEDDRERNSKDSSLVDLFIQ